MDNLWTDDSEFGFKLFLFGYDRGAILLLLLGVDVKLCK